MNPETNIQDILQRAIQGEETACTFLYEQYADPLYRYIYYRIGNRTDAEDMLQDVFLKIYTHLPSMKPDDRGMLPYFYTIARNTVIDYMRKKRNEVSLDDFEYVVDDGHNPEETALQGEAKDEVNKLLSRLPADIREIVILRYITGLSNKEISEITGKSEDALRQIQSRAIRSLKSYLEKHGK